MDDLLTTLGKQLVTVGPVGIVVLVGWYLWLKWGRVLPVTEDRAHEWHVENRDTLRDTNERTQRMCEMQDEELKVLRDIASQQARLADVLQAFMLKTGMIRPRERRR